MVDFMYYSTVFLGQELTEENFPYFSRQAERYLQFVTAGRYKDVCEDQQEVVKDCICELAELEQKQKNLESKIENGQVISSESVGSYSASYVTPKSAEENEDIQNQRYSVVKKYLAFTGLLYRGVCHVS